MTATQITAVIIEDEKPAARKLARLLADLPAVELVATLHSVEEGVAWFRNNPPPQLIFADIVLGDGLSFDIFEAEAVRSFIIYTTAFDQYTLKAFKLNSIDYLLKPITPEDLAGAVAKYRSFVPNAAHDPIPEAKALMQQEKPRLSRLLVKIGYNLKIVQTAEVTCFFSENKIVYAQTSERAYPTDFTLDELETLLQPELFFRVNRQFIICCDAIKNIHTSPVYRVDLTHSPELEITVSRERVRDFKEWLSK